MPIESVGGVGGMLKSDNKNKIFGKYIRGLGVKFLVESSPTPQLIRQISGT